MNSKAFIQRFSRCTIGVIGDVMLDRYLLGDADRISAEAPTPIVLLKEEKCFPGGAANTAANITSLGGVAVLLGYVGKDQTGKDFMKLLRDIKIEGRGIFIRSSVPTIEKIRIHARSQQIARIDREEFSPLNRSEEEKVIQFLREHLKNWDAVVVSDYLKGFITMPIAETIVKLSQHYKRPLIVDTKPPHLNFFKGATIFTPNKKEAEEAFGQKIINEEHLEKAGHILQKRLRSDILITRGAEGMSIFDGKKATHLPSVAREVFDVTGAGDTVAAVMALGAASGCSLLEATILANIAAGLAVGKRGTATVSLTELRDAYESFYKYAGKN